MMPPRSGSGERGWPSLSSSPGGTKRLTAATEALNRLRGWHPKSDGDAGKKGKTPNSYRLERGLYSQPRETLIAGVPASLPALEPQEDQPLNRLDLARWLTHRNHPLTARVTVNRLWQQLFGIGLVKTSEDFGIRGEIPEHMALAMDWLSAQFAGFGLEPQGTSQDHLDQ